MNNIKLIRENPELFKKKFKERSLLDYEKIVTKILEDDTKVRTIIQNQQEYQEKRNLISKNLSNITDKTSEEFKKLSNEVLEIKKNIEETEIKINNINNDIIKIMSELPNIHDDSVPVGKGSKENKEIRKYGEVKNFPYKTLSHDDIGIKKKLFDFETAAKISGSRFVILNSVLAKLERVLINFMVETHVKEFGYNEVNVPIIVNESTMFGTGQLPKFKKEQYELTNKQWLIPTAEVSLTNIFREKILDYKDLPIRYVASTPCFRAEAGAAGQDTKGILRQHQFYKVELVSAVEPKKRMEELERMTSCAEAILQKLELPYRVSLLSSGDIGFSAEKTYDIEVWLPSQNAYREISSCSSCGQFQAIRMNAKYKNSEKKNDHIATLNGSGLAIGRTIIAIMENYQDKNGDIIIPKILQPLMGVSKI